MADRPSLLRVCRQGAHLDPKGLGRPRAGRPQRVAEMIFSPPEKVAATAPRKKLEHGN